MTMEYKSNYEKVTEDWKKRFLDMDQERLIERFQLNHDGQWLYLRYLGQQLKLCLQTEKKYRNLIRLLRYIICFTMQKSIRQHPGNLFLFAW